MKKSTPDLTPLTHVTREGHAHVDHVGGKDVTARHADPGTRGTFERLAAGDTKKGDVLAAARIAGIQAAKRTSELIPLCHMIALTKVEVAIALDEKEGLARIDATAEARDRTGVEMEALVAASTAALTLYDMLKAIDRAMSFDVCLVSKTGGKTGEWTRDEG